MVAPGIPVGVHVLCERGDEVLLLRRAGTGFFDGCFSLPGGHVEEGESAFAAAARELAEETGLVVARSELDWLGAVHRRSDTSRIDFFLQARSWQGEARILEPDKCDLMCWRSRQTLPQPMVAYVELALRQPAMPWFLELGWD